MKKYIITFLITSTIFLSAFFISDRVNVSRIEQLNSVQEKISLNILETETRFALLKEASCENVFEGSQLEIGITKDLNQLVNRIKFLESELGGDNEDVQLLKQRYTLLQIKDYLLVNELNSKCDYTIATLLYFHTSDCFDCRKQSIVLDQLRSEYDQVRVYWLDASINESTIETLERLYEINTYPTLVLDEQIYSGFISYDELLQNISRWAEENDVEILSEAQQQARLTEIENIREFIAGDGVMDGITVTRISDSEFSFVIDGDHEGVVLIDEAGNYMFKEEENTN